MWRKIVENDHNCSTNCPYHFDYEIADLPARCAECLKDTAGDIAAHELMDERMVNDA